MDYRSVAETAKIWGVSERSVRNYCAEGRVEGAVLIGKTWSIPETAQKPERLNKTCSRACGRRRRRGCTAASTIRYRST